jgi:hypothetical protein
MLSDRVQGFGFKQKGLGFRASLCLLFYGFMVYGFGV